jgi:hypothetical protein
VIATPERVLPEGGTTMNTKPTALAIGLAALVGGTVLGPLHADAADPQTASWFKPPMPCALVRARVQRIRPTGWCPSLGPRRHEIQVIVTESASGIDPLIFTIRSLAR